MKTTIELLSKLLSIKTYKQLFFLLILGVSGLCGYTAYENRAFLFEYVTNSTSTKRDYSIQKLDTYFDELLLNESISTVIFSTIDLKLNTKTIVHWKSKQSIIDNRLNEVYRNQRTTQLLTDDGRLANDLVIQIITNRAVCMPYNNFYNLSTVKSQIRFICSISVPPIYGKTGGVLTILLNPLSKLDKQNLILLLNRYSNEIASNGLMNHF